MGTIDFASARPNVCGRTKIEGLDARPEKILRMRTVLERTGLSRSTLYRKMKCGTFPSQVQLSEHCCGWRESAINRWISDPMSYRDDCVRGVRRPRAVLRTEC